MANGSQGSRVPLRKSVSDPPKGLHRIRWWGPGLLWAMSAVGSGSVLFTPRVGSEYGYGFLWLLLSVAFLMWIMIREAGRFSVATGRTLLDGFSTLPGPRNWALWAVFVPQLFAAVVGVGGLSALVGSALAVELPGSLVFWSLVVLAVSLAVVVAGGYPLVSRVALVLALVLVATTLVAATRVFRLDGDALSGLIPNLPANVDVPFLLPWVGTILAGSMGIIWFSYWAARQGYGGSVTGEAREDWAEEHEAEAPLPQQVSIEQRNSRLSAWFRTLSNTAAVGVVTGTLIISAFLILGTELLGPAGIVPSGPDVATELTRLLSDIWGRVGHWLMVGAIVVALGGSVLANQDGWSRSFADVVLLIRERTKEGETGDGLRLRLPEWSRTLLGWLSPGMKLRRALKTLFAVTVTGLAPALVIVVVRDPVAIMSASGVIAAIHTPFIVFTTLAVNLRLADPLRPGARAVTMLGLAGLFYTLFAALFFADLLGLVAA